MKPKLRQALPSDAPRLRALRVEAGWGVEEVAGWYEAVERGERSMWVAELDGSVVAMVALEFVDVDPDVADGGPTASVTSLAVTASAARRGLGRLLTQFAEDEARARGVRMLTLNTRPTNAVALALYQGLGYRVFKSGPRSWGEAVYLRKPLEASR